MILFAILASSLAFVDPMIGTEGVGSEYGGMMPMTGVPFGSMHLVPVTRTDAVGNSSVHGNETCHHVAYLYNRIGKHEKTCRRVHDILTRCYSANRRGFDGNEDCGAMSAWYILSALGFYPLDPASGEYEIGAPLINGATLKLGGTSLKIAVCRRTPDAWRVTRVTLNGRELTDLRVKHADLLKGGVLSFDVN